MMTSAVVEDVADPVATVAIVAIVRADIGDVMLERARKAVHLVISLLASLVAALVVAAELLPPPKCTLVISTRRSG